MKFKIALIIIFVTGIIQVLNYSYTAQKAADVFEQENRALELEISKINSQITSLQREIKNLGRILESIPPEFWDEYKDPEAEFMEFLNFIAAMSHNEMGIRVNMRRSPFFSSSPVSHHESHFSFSFSFVDINQAENLIHHIFRNDRFPVKLSSMSLQGTGSGEVRAEINLSLHIPATASHTFLKNRDIL